VSYNILCDFYRMTKEWGYTIKDFQAFLDHGKIRNNWILEELKFYNADVICLQELTETNYLNFYKPALKELGFESIFYKKYKENKSIAVTENRENIDGCGTFIKSSKLDIKNSKFIDLREVVLKNKFDKDLKLVPNETKSLIFLGDQIATLLLVENVITGNLYCIANTHIISRDENIQLLQIKLCTLSIAKYLKRYNNCSIIFCGDFNSSPETNAYKFLTSGHVNHKGIFYNHQLNLSSAYGNFLGKEPYGVDYIFYSNDLLDPQKILKIPNQKTKKLTKQYPSDHKALFCLLKNMQNTQNNDPNQVTKDKQIENINPKNKVISKAENKYNAPLQ